MADKPGVSKGGKAYDWLQKKLGNPVMPSNEKKEIKELEEEERRLREMREKQERGEDYPADWHKRQS